MYNTPAMGIQSKIGTLTATPVPSSRRRSRKVAVRNNMNSRIDTRMEYTPDWDFVRPVISGGLYAIGASALGKKKTRIMSRQGLVMMGTQAGISFIAGTFLEPMIRRALVQYPNIEMLIRPMAVGLASTGVNLIFTKGEFTKEIPMNALLSMGADFAAGYLDDMFKQML